MSWAKSAPYKPDWPFVVAKMITAITPTIAVGRSAPPSS